MRADLHCRHVYSGIAVGSVKVVCEKSRVFVHEACRITDRDKVGCAR